MGARRSRRAIRLLASGKIQGGIASTEQDEVPFSGERGNPSPGFRVQASGFCANGWLVCFSMDDNSRNLLHQPMPASGLLES